MSYAVAYVDASFDLGEKIAACTIHVVYPHKSVDHYKHYSCEDSSQAERMGVEYALELVHSKDLTVFTDARDVTELIEFTRDTANAKLRHLKKTKRLRHLMRKFDNVHVEWIPGHDKKYLLMQHVHSKAKKSMKKFRRKTNSEKASKHPENP